MSEPTEREWLEGIGERFEREHRERAIAEGAAIYADEDVEIAEQTLRISWEALYGEDS